MDRREARKILQAVASREESGSMAAALQMRRVAAQFDIVSCGLRPSMDCRPACGACCIALSISSPIPGMPEGKPAGVRCIHLTPDLRCAIFGHADRPAVCSSLRPMPEMCGSTQEEALRYLVELDRLTRPGASAASE